MSEVRALLLTDVVDSTALGQSLGDDAMAALWAAHDRLARELLPPHRGREIDKTDGMLLMFERADDAVAYARAYHAALATLEPPLRARAGLHVGPVVLRENPADDVARGAKPIEVDGIAKPTAARVMALACGSQTLLTRDALHALHAAGAAPRAHGHWRVKGVADPIELFELDGGPGTTPPDGDKAYRVARVGDRWLPVREVPNNLPQPASSFVGRGGELDAIKALLREARLVSLVGMGGLGKTRLALQCATELLAEFPDGAWFLDLVPLREPARVVEEAARLLRVQEEAGRLLLHTLCAQLRERRLLLVVDNCEHLVDAAAALVDALVRAAPDLCVLATSRTVLRLPGERVVPVLPLPLPGVGDDAKALAQSSAVRLFVERARSQRPDFAPDAREAGQVAELVARLEGIPLAIELAAARVRSLAVADINARLADRYRLLTGGSRVAQPRQQTLRALVDWSYELLRPPEQTLLQRLGVFAGGFDLAAAEAVCGADPIDPLDVVDLVDSLVEKSLVMPDRGGERTRYRMLETLREYAREKLDAGGDAAA
ncbi:MAG: ATP-binding protein, partial [Gammaproteobacteria bacterium]